METRTALIIYTVSCIVSCFIWCIEPTEVDKAIKYNKQLRKSHYNDSLAYETGWIYNVYPKWSNDNPKLIKYTKDRRVNKCYAIYGNGSTYGSLMTCVPCDSLVMAHIKNKYPPKRFETRIVVVGDTRGDSVSTDTCAAQHVDTTSVVDTNRTEVSVQDDATTTTYEFNRPNTHHIPEVTGD